MPADVAGCARQHRCGLLIAVGCKQHESGAVRIPGDGETSNARNVLGTTVDRAAGLLDTACIGVDIVDPDVTHPRRGWAKDTVLPHAGSDVSRICTRDLRGGRSPLARDHREHRALRVATLGDPTAAGNLRGTMHHLAAAGL